VRVLAFDASSEIGWAAFAGARARPQLGTFSIPTGDYGRINNAVLTTTLQLIDKHRPDVVAFESPIYKPRDRWHTRRLLTGLVVIIELAAEQSGKRCMEVPPTEAKRCLTGDCRADKDAMEVAAVNMGWPVADHHQADAAAVALVVYGHLARSLEYPPRLAAE